MAIKASEISELIKSRIQNFTAATEARSVGSVVTVTDGICRVHGLQDAMQGEMLEFPKNTFGLALNLERDSVGAVILGEYEHISEGDTVKCTRRILEVPVGPALIGRVVNALGQPIDGKGPVDTKEFDVIEKVAPGVIARQPVSEPVQTGLKAIDAMVPNSSSAIARPARRQLPSIRSSTRRARTSSASTSRSARRLRQSRTSSASSKRPVRWRTRSSSRRPRQNRPRCSTSRPTPAARWASTSAIAARTR
jgi:vacuolar-type H+-ATPase subunit B/Vma2